MRRLFGFVLILRGLAPLLIVSILLLVGNALIRDVHAAITPPLTEIESSVTTIRNTLSSESRIDLAQVQEDVNAAATWLEDNADLTTIARIDDWRVLGVNIAAPINGLIDTLNGIINSINNTFSRLARAFRGLGNALEPVVVIPDEISNINTQIVQASADVRATLNGWSVMLNLASFAIFSLTLLYVGAGMIDDVTRGLSLLRAQEK